MLLFVAALRAQAPASLEGRIVDASGAAISGVEVRLSAGPDSRAAVTNRDGAYVFTALPPGTYTLEAAMAGFETFYRRDLRLAGGQHLRVDATLEVGAVIEHVLVTAKAPPLEGSPEVRARNFQEYLEIREVRESAARDVGEALAGLAGLWKVRKGGIANDVVLRGFQSGNINMLIDGVRIQGACPNHMDPPAFHVDFAEIQQVEVTKGAFDMTSQGGLGGAVRIVNKSPEDRLRITPSLTVGSFGFVNSSITGSAGGEKAYVLAGHSYRRSAAYHDGSGRAITSYANYRATNGDPSAFDIHTGWFKLVAAPASNQRFTLGYTRQRGGETLYPYLMMDAGYDNADRIQTGYTIDRPGGLLEHVHAEGYFSRVRHWMTDERRVSSAGAALPFSMATFAATKTLGGRLDGEFRGFSVGVEGYRRFWNAVNTMRMGTAYMDQPSVPDVVMNAGGAYAQYRRTFRRLLVQAGARYDLASTEARSASLNTDLYWAYNGTRARSRHDADPSASVWASYDLGRGLEMFSGIGRTVRLPDPQERFFALKRSGSDWVGNPNLPSSRNTEADVGLNLRRERFTLRPTLFYSRLADYIVLHNQTRLNAVAGVMNPFARSYQNVDARMYGGELSYSVRFSQSLLLTGGVSQVRGTRPGRDLAEMPPLKARTGLRYGNRLWFAEVEGLAARAQDRVDAEVKESRTPGYGVLNVRAGIHSRRLNLSAGIDNLLDRFYYEHFSYQRDPFRLGVRVPEPGRNVFATLSYAF
ncbi:MAG: TonB-dependent receptor domain-containing protein [Bryobacteraceae bacterium]